MEGESAQINIFMLDSIKDGLGPIPFVFKIYPDEANQSRLRDWIELCGGVVLDPGEDDPYAITVLDSRWYVEEKRIRPPTKLPTDIFCCSFISKSYFRNKFLDLNSYRISKSLYEDFDANLILTRKMAWNEVKRIPHGAKPRKQTGSYSSNNNTRGNKEAARIPTHSEGKSNRLGMTSELTAEENFSAKGVDDFVWVDTSHPNLYPSDSEGSDFQPRGISTPVKRWLRPNKGSSQKKRKVDQAGGPSAVKESADESEDTMKGKSDEGVQTNAHDDDESNDRNQYSNQTFRSPRRSCEEAPRLPSSSRHTGGVRSKYFLTAEQDRNGPRPANTRSVAQAVSDSSSEYSVHETASRATSNSTLRRGAPYTLEEGQIILDYICKHHLHDEVKGIRIWTLMEDKQVLGTRTALSMKEHFRKKIFPTLMSKSNCPYTCSAGDKRRFKEADTINHRGTNKKPGRVPQRRHFKLRDVPV